MSVKKSILITRPVDQAREITEILNKMGFETNTHPIMRISQTVNKIPEKFHRRQWIITSQNGARIIAPMCVDKNHKIYAVGEGTAKYCRALGLKNILFPQYTIGVKSLLDLLNNEKVNLKKTWFIFVVIILKMIF